MKKIISLILIASLACFLFACAAGAPRSQKGLGAGALIGAVGGALLGQAIGGDTEATLIGAGIGTLVGGATGHQIGAYMDRQEAELRSAVAGVESAGIRRTQDVLTATFRSETLFDFNSFTLKPGAHSELARVADVLVKYPYTSIRVEGHTDATGSEQYNQILSEKRADAVKRALVQRGVSARRIQVIGFGESQPISSSNAMNRRVNIVIIPT